MLAVNQLNGFGCRRTSGGCTCTPAYDSGDRTGSITVTTDLALGGAGGIAAWVNGLNDLTMWFVSQSVAGKYIKFDFGAATKLTEATSTQDNATAEGTWKWQYSIDDSTWVDVGGSFALGGATSVTHTSLNGNEVGARYWRLLGVSGSSSSSPYQYEITFKRCTC